MSRLLTYSIIQQKKINLLLDSYPGASVAFSFRKLYSSYSGYCVRVRRSSDNSEQDIGFNSLGVLDSSALLTFVGSSAGNIGYVRTWYDQSGNANNLIQTTTASQPRICDSGSLYTVNGKTALFNGVLNFTTNISALGDHSVYACVTHPSTNFYIIAGSAAYYTYNATGYAQRVDGSKCYYKSTLFSNVSSILEFYKISNVTSGYQNNTSKSYGAESSFNNSSTTFTYIQPASRNYAELICYSSDKSSDRSGIIGNINAFYGLF